MSHISIKFGSWSPTAPHILRLTTLRVWTYESPSRVQEARTWTKLWHINTLVPIVMFVRCRKAHAYSITPPQLVGRWLVWLATRKPSDNVKVETLAVDHVLRAPFRAAL